MIVIALLLLASAMLFTFGDDDATPTAEPGE